MKRELVALEAGSLAIDSGGRITRSNRQLSGVDSNGISAGLVYKRVKIPAQTRDSELLSVSTNGVNDSKDDVMQNGVGNNVEEKDSDEVRGDSKEVEVLVEGKEGLLVLLNQNDGLVKNVEAEDEVNKLPVEEPRSECNLDCGDVFSLEGSNPVIDDVVNEKDAAVEVEKDRVLEGTLPKSPVNAVGEKGKKSSVKGYPKRFTRSALMVIENGNEIMSNSDVEVGGDGTISQTHLTENVNGEFKNSSVEKIPRRFTRSSLQLKVDKVDSSMVKTTDSAVTKKKNAEKTKLVVTDENVEADVEKSMTATPKRKMEMKMSKQIALARMPSNVQELLETGLLEGCPVYYKGGKGNMLRGRIRGLGILCFCGLCRGCKVVAPSLFEFHARNIYKRAAQYICLENGRSFMKILKGCKITHPRTLEATVQNAIGPLPEKKMIHCQNCKEPFYTMDAESTEAVCSSCFMSNTSPVGPVCSFRNLHGLSEAFLTPSLRSSPRFAKCSATRATEEITKNQEEAFVEPETSSSSSMGKFSEAKACGKLVKKSSKAALPTKLSGSTRASKSPPANGFGKTTKRLKKEVLSPKPLKSPSVGSSSGKNTSGKITRKDLKLHKLVFEDDILPDGTELGYYVRGQKLLGGYKKGSGIFCSCCETVVSASLFEAHAGCASRRKPYCYIYTSNGISLHELSVKLIQARTHSAQFNDDLCSICADGGNLLLCDGCPRAFHTECASLSSVPQGKWYCKYCQNMFERESFVAHNANAVAAGRVSGVDPMEQITTRSIRIVDTLASELSSCILCRGYDFCKSGFGPRTIILCDQCEKEYHVGCLKDHNLADLKELPDGKWFCSVDCERIDSALQNILDQGAEKLHVPLVDIIQKKHAEKGSECEADFDISWRLLGGKIASPEIRPFLSQAVAIFHESFSPIIDRMSGQDLIAAMVYGRSVAGQEYGGMYCAVLTVNSVVVSAGIVRVFGPGVAELPLVATSTANQGKGYFQALFSSIERLLAFLQVKSLVLPAAEEAESIWTDHFGFTKMSPDEHHEFRKNYWSIVRFQGTSMLHKQVPEVNIFQSYAT